MASVHVNMDRSVTNFFIEFWREEVFVRVCVSVSADISCGNAVPIPERMGTALQREKETYAYQNRV